MTNDYECQEFVVRAQDHDGTWYDDEIFTIKHRAYEAADRLKESGEVLAVKVETHEISYNMGVKISDIVVY